jgi:hypothetical protein
VTTVYEKLNSIFNTISNWTSRDTEFESIAQLNFDTIEIQKSKSIP